MGTSCACIYATIFFAYFERKILLPKYKKNLLFYKQKIDNIFGVWVANPENPNAWNEFQNDLNNLSNLEWNTDELSGTVNFLDLTLWIDKKSNNIQYSTYQKPMNLFLYIPQHSASPPGLLNSLIFGLVGTYKRQNSSIEDFKVNVGMLFNRLLARGYKRDTLVEVFKEVATNLVSAPPSVKSKCTNPSRPKSQSQSQSTTSCQDNTDSRLFFHLPYHPRGVVASNKHIRISVRNPMNWVNHYAKCLQRQGAR